MAIDRIRKVAIVGGGVMGRGIALLTSQKGVYTIVKETNVDLSSRARESIFEKIDKAGPKLLCPSPQFAKDRISVTTEFSDIQDADLVIEAVPEDPSLKEDVFREIDVWVKPDALIVSNTSSLSVSEMAKATSRPGQVMGAHFFNPPVRRNLVELIRAKPTSEHTFQVVKNLVEQTLERHTIEVKECPGFLVNRVLLPGPNEAGLLLCETTLGAKEIDNRARAFGWPLGPFELLDYIGIDIAFGVAKILHLAYGDRMKPAPILEILFNLGRLGNKSGAGFYNNGSDEELVKIVEDNFTDRRNLSLDDGFDRMLAGQLLEVLRCLEEDIATPEDIEKGCRHGINWPLARDEGPLHYIQNTLGLTDLLEMSKQARDSSQYADRFIPPAILEEMVTKGENKFFEDEEDW